MVSGSLRTGWSRPARSAILGMIAAALGIERGDEDMHQALEAGVRTAMLVERPGEVFNDFHTAQAASGKPNWTTRGGEVAAIKADDNPVVSLREYRTNIVVLATFWLGDNAVHSLDAICQALRKPRFVLYMGRKCCPFGLPLAPEIVEAASPIQALLGRYKGGPEREFLNELRGRRPAPYIALDQTDGTADTSRIEFRADRLLSRRRWQFLPRGEAILPITIPA